jgi:transcriptional regulator with XRE-family HTH domain
MRNVDGTASPLAFFGAELRRVRNEAGLSQEQLGQRIGYSGTLIGKVEIGQRAPSEDLAERCDEALETKGLLPRIYDLARRWDGGYPSWFAGWAERERTAASICWWEPLLIPGLVQTPEYARALFLAWQSGDTSDDQVEELVSARLERQKIFDQSKLPELWVIVDEAVLRRCIGAAKIMHDQLSYLASQAKRPNITVQVVPGEVGAHVGLTGAFAIASGNGVDTVYMESPDEGQTTEAASVVAKLTKTFNILRGEALSQAASRELIMKVAEESWT